MSQQSRKASEKAFKEMLEKSGGKVFIGMVHQIYGPLRGLNFVLKNTKPKEVFDFIEKSWEPVAPETQIKMIEKLRAEGGPPKNIKELQFKIWNETSLSVQPAILPFEMVEQAENTPDEVNTIEEGLKKVNRSLYLTSKIQAKDPWFFRVGIV